MSEELQIVYVLTNPAMPGMTKIGMTSGADVEDRMKQLYSTGVPVPFECEYACRVKDAARVERAIQAAFRDSRVNPNREFFKIAPDRIVSVLELLAVEEVTTDVNKEINSEIDSEDRQSVVRLKAQRRPNMNFIEMGIPVGSILKFRDGSVEAKVTGERTVELQGKELYLSPATKKILGMEDDKPIRPAPYWLFNGRTLDDIYEEVYSDTEAA